MKAKLLMLLTFLLPIVMTSCDDDDTTVDNIYIYNTEATVDATEGQFSVTVASQGNWTATPDQTWLTVTPSSGNTTGHNVVVVSYEANTTAEPRTGNILFVAGNITTTLTVTQKAQ